MFRYQGFTPRAGNAVGLGVMLASLWGHTYIGSEHLLLGLLRAGYPFLEQEGVSFARCRQAVLKRVGQGEGGGRMLGREDLTSHSQAILQNAVLWAGQQGKHAADLDEILLAILWEKESCAVELLRGMGVDPNKWIRLMGGQAEPPAREEWRSGRTVRGEPARRESSRQLDKFSRDLTRLAEEKRLDPVIGREREIDRCLQILVRRTKNNPCLVGEAGVGKTAVAEGLAQRLADGQVPDALQGKRLLALDLCSMIAGTKYRGDFEGRVESILQEVKREGNIILFIDELHTLVGVGGAEGAIDAANILKPQLARGDLQVMGATTLEEFRRYIEKDGALERRFQSEEVEEPDQDQTVAILTGLRDRYERHHRLKITDEAIRRAVELSVRYLPDRRLPDKAIDLMDEAASQVRLCCYAAEVDTEQLEQECARLEGQLRRKSGDGEEMLRAALEQKRRELAAQTALRNRRRERIVTGEDVTALVSRTTGVPLSALTRQESQDLLGLESQLGRWVIGQEEAVQAVSRAVRRSRVGLRDPRRPVGSFLFLGPSGVGKTRLCRALADALFGDPEAVIQLDMSEYMEKHSVSRLTGSPPGYVGYDDAGQLTEQVRRRPYSVVLFDEIEKAHPDIFNLLLQVMEEGCLTDTHGRKASFRNAVVIMTSNVGARFVTECHALGFGAADDEEKSREGVMTQLRQTFRPEFLGRFDETILFHRLGTAELTRIAAMMLEEVAQRLEKLEIRVAFSSKTAQGLAAACREKAQGARPLRRAVRRQVEDPLATRILSGQLRAGEEIRCGWNQGGLTVEKVEPVPV